MKKLLIAVASAPLFCLALSALIIHDIERRERRVERTVEQTRALSPAEIAWSMIDTLRPPLRCNASWYSYPEHGRKTASGEIIEELPG